MSHKRKAKASSVEESSTKAGKLLAGTPEESSTSRTSACHKSPTQEAESGGSAPLSESQSNLHATPHQEVDAGKNDEFKSRTPMLIEVFCGTAGVSAQFKLAGGKSVGVDHHIKRRKLKAAAVQMDLKQQWVQQLIFDEVASGRVDSVHMAPPCGTSSAARNIPISRKLLKQGAPRPRPLRSPKYPDGLPTLRGISLAKVESANILYAFCVQLALLCEQHRVLFIIENPENSLMWMTSPFKSVMEKFVFSVVDNCEYGSEYKKATGFLSNFSPGRLQSRCLGKHVHKKWTIEKDLEGNWKFSTSQEAEYPIALAKAIALSFIDKLSTMKSISLIDDLGDHAAKVSTYLQPRRSRGPLLLSEFKTKVQISCNPDTEVPKSITHDTEYPWQGIPIGSKWLETQPVHDAKGEVVRLVATYGVYYTEKEFLHKALEIEHPFDTPLPLEESNLDSIAFICGHGPGATAKFRADQLRYYIGRAKDLDAEEKKLHLQLHESLQPVLEEGRRLLLFKEMLN